MNNHYELLYLVPAKFTDEEIEQAKNLVKELITKHGGNITLEDSLGKKKLAYPIKKILQGAYLLIEFDIEGENLKKFNEDLRLEPKILRHQVIKKAISTPSFVDITKELIDAEPAKVEKEEKKVEDKKKVKIEDLDKKLDEILEGDIL